MKMVIYYKTISPIFRVPYIQANFVQTHCFSCKYNLLIVRDHFNVRNEHFFIFIEGNNLVGLLDQHSGLLENDTTQIKPLGLSRLWTPT